MKPLPFSVMRLIGLVANSGSSLNDIEKIISIDPVLTARLLRTANSAMHGAHGSVSTIHEAVLRLGTGYLLTIAIAACLEKDFREDLPQYGFPADKLWYHSVAAALAIRTASKFIKMETPPEAYVAALLHDIGKLVIARYVEPEILAVLQSALQEQKLSPSDTEKEILKATHGEIGALMAQHWRMPESISTAILHHHHPEAGQTRACYFVWMSNLVAHSIEGIIPNDEQKSKPSMAAQDREAICSYFNLTEAALNAYCMAVSQDLDEALKQFSGRRLI